MEQVEEEVTEGRGKGGKADKLLMFFYGHGGKVLVPILASHLPFFYPHCQNMFISSRILMMIAKTQNIVQVPLGVKGQKNLVTKVYTFNQMEICN